MASRDFPGGISQVEFPVCGGRSRARKPRNGDSALSEQKTLDNELFRPLSSRPFSFHRTAGPFFLASGPSMDAASSDLVRGIISLR